MRILPERDSALQLFDTLQLSMSFVTQTVSLHQLHRLSRLQITRLLINTSQTNSLRYKPAPIYPPLVFFPVLVLRITVDTRLSTGSDLELGFQRSIIAGVGNGIRTREATRTFQNLLNDEAPVSNENYTDGSIAMVGNCLSHRRGRRGECPAKGHSELQSFCTSASIITDT